VVLAALGLLSSAELSVESALCGDIAVKGQVGLNVQPAGDSSYSTTSMQAGALISLGSHWTAAGHLFWARAAEAAVSRCGSIQKRYSWR
jgi:hypothetical protein